jgi:hypothetical protein
MSCARLAAVPLLLAAACSSEPTQPPGNTTDGSTTSSTADAAGNLDAMMSNADATPGDAPIGADQGPRADATPGPDGSTMSALCMELEACCPLLPQQVQGQCFMAASGGDDGACQQGLDLAAQLGLCGPMTDAGPMDVGPPGPVCAELEACCPEFAPVEQVCRNAVARRDEARCQQLINGAQQLGRCLGMPDAGIADAGTSTVGDAGTSTTADGG